MPLSDRYVEWFQPIGHELRRGFKPNGTFILRNASSRGAAHTHVLELIQALRARRGGYGPSQRAKASNLATALSDGSAVKHALMGHGISLPA